MASRKQKMEQLVVRHNDLVQKSQHELTEQQQNILQYMVAEVGENDKPDTIYRFSIKEFAETYNLNMDGGYYTRTIREDILKIDEQRFFLIDEREPMNKKKWKRLRWLNVLRGNDENGVIEYNFHDDMRPYLFELKKHFNQCKQKYLAALSGTYSRQLYAFLKSHAYQHKAIFVQIEHLRVLLGADETYPRYVDFKRHILDAAIAQINDITDINVKYCVSKTGARGAILELAFRVIPLDESVIFDDCWRENNKKVNEILGIEEE